MINVTINISGKTLSDIEQGIDESKKRIINGNIEGFDSNDDGEFNFVVTGDEYKGEYRTGGIVKAAWNFLNEKVTF